MPSAQDYIDETPSGKASAQDYINSARQRRVRVVRRSQLRRALPRAAKGASSFSNRLASGISNFDQQRQQAIMYSRRGIRRPTNRNRSGVRYGRVGRPKGTIDPRYAKFGGVYGYRKYLAARNAQLRAQLSRDSTLTPEQQLYLQQQQARQRASQMNPENRVIPDTRGNIDMMDQIQREIDEATRIVG